LSPALQAQRFFARARQFRLVAADLADMDGTEPNWPKWFLVTHAIELAIRAFIVSRKDLDIPPPPTPEPTNHDFVSLYDYAVLCGLTRNQLVPERLPQLSELHQVHYARYPKTYVKRVVLTGYFDDPTDQLFADISRAIAFR
jgi:hypothetical protein